jgi:hypothetical protein
MSSLKKSLFLRKHSQYPLALSAVTLTESVTSMDGRADLLAGMALLSGFRMYLRSAETQGRLSKP